MNISSFVFITTIISYISILFVLYYGWKKTVYFIPSFSKKSTQKKISVIIVVRNEEKNIGSLLHDLSQQTHTDFEVIIIDDHSTDNTKKTIASIVKNSIINIRYFTLNYQIDRLCTPKKAAIRQGIFQAAGEIIVTTDGDCRVKKKWLQNIHDYFQQYEAKLVSGPVVFMKEKNTFEKMQSIEFAALIATGAASIYLNKPNMCNGANLAYTKEVFEQVDGFQGNTKIASGDDEFFMHKVALRFPTQVHFLKNQENIVATYAQEKALDFFHQRKRWASKWKYYESYQTQLAALGVYCFHCLFAAFVVAGIFGFLSPTLFIVLFCLKILAEYIYIKQSLRFFGKEKLKCYILPLSFIYSFYVIIIGLATLIKGYNWKGRKWQ